MTAVDSPTLAEPPVRTFQKRTEPSNHYSDRGRVVTTTEEAVPMRFDGTKLLPKSFLDAVKAARERQTSILSDRERLLKGRTLKEAQERAERALAVYGQLIANGQPPGEKPLSTDEVRAAWDGFTHRFRVNCRILGAEAAKAARHLADQLDSLAKDCATACTTLAGAAGVHLEHDPELGFVPTIRANSIAWRTCARLWDEELADRQRLPPAAEAIDDIIRRFQLEGLV